MEKRDVIIWAAYGIVFEPVRWVQENVSGIIVGGEERRCFTIGPR